MKTTTVRMLLGCAAAPLIVGAALAQPNGLRFEEVTATHLPAEGAFNTMDVEVIDLNRDGLPDLATAQEFLTNKVLLNTGAGRFADASGVLEALSDAEMAGGPPQLRFPGAGHDSEDVSVADFNGDGLVDILIVAEDDVKFGRTDVHELYLAQPDGRFARARDAGLPDTEANGVAHADIDGDGDVDVLIVGAGQDRLLINDGAARFADETPDRLPREAATAQDAEFADLNGDGRLDIVLGLEGGHAIWINDGAGRFIDETAARLPDPGNVEARKVAVADVDGDGHPDLYFAHVAWQGREGQDRLLINDGAGRFTDQTADRIPTETQTTVDARFADLDGDGDLDLVRGNMGPVTVWLNDGTGRFTDATEAVFAAPVTGANLAVELHDFDGDGLIDLFVGQLRGPQGPTTARDRLLLQRRDAG